MFEEKKDIKRKNELLNELKNHHLNKILFLEGVSRRDVYKLNQVINSFTHYNSEFDVILVEKRQ